MTLVNNSVMHTEDTHEVTETIVLFQGLMNSINLSTFVSIKVFRLPIVQQIIH